MGILSLAFSLADRVLTYVLMLFIADMVYQLCFHLVLVVLVQGNGPVVGLISFRPEISKYVVSYLLVKRVIV
jgi:hypothetical protein